MFLFVFKIAKINCKINCVVSFRIFKYATQVYQLKSKFILMTAMSLIYIVKSIKLHTKCCTRRLLCYQEWSCGFAPQQPMVWCSLPRLKVHRLNSSPYRCWLADLGSCMSLEVLNWASYKPDDGYWIIIMMHSTLLVCLWWSLRNCYCHLCLGCINAVTVQNDGGQNYNDDNWHHLMVVRSGKTASIYVDSWSGGHHL